MQISYAYPPEVKPEIAQGRYFTACSAGFPALNK
jgi:hypothetical protein